MCTFSSFSLYFEDSAYKDLADTPRVVRLFKKHNALVFSPSSKVLMRKIVKNRGMLIAEVTPKIIFVLPASLH